MVLAEGLGFRIKGFRFRLLHQMRALKPKTPETFAFSLPVASEVLQAFCDALDTELHKASPGIGWVSHAVSQTLSNIQGLRCRDLIKGCSASECHWFQPLKSGTLVHKRGNDGFR